MPQLGRIGNYRLEGKLGRGAVGVVYRALDDCSGRIVALKAIRLDLFSDEEKAPIIARLRREAEIGMRLDHPGIVKVLNFLATEEIAALAMELVEGENLAQLSSGNGIEWQAAIRATRQLLLALSYAHSSGVIHRDVKPANIIFPRTAESGIKLTDFGIARISVSTLTCEGDVIGTPAYMSPEQFQGIAIDERSDIFSTGATLYALLAGRPPFSGPLPSVMRQLLHESPQPLSSLRGGLPRSLDEIIGRAMAKDPASRFASADAFIAALDETLLAAAGPWQLSEAPSDETVILPQSRALRDATRTLDALATLLETAVLERITEKRLAEARKLCAALADAPLTPVLRTRALDLCTSRGLIPLADIALDSAPLPGVRRASARSDFIAVTTLMGICSGLSLKLGAEIHPAVQHVAATLQEAAARYASSLSESLSAEDNPDLVAISANFMRLDVLQLGLEMLGADGEKQSLAATEMLLINQVMARINATFRRYAQTGDMFARFEVAVFLTEIEELIVLAERLVARSTELSSAFHAVGRQTLAEFLRNVGILAQSTVDELLHELSSAKGSIPAFASRIKQLGLIYAFAARFDEPASRSSLQDLSAQLYHLMERLAGEVITHLKAALVLGELSRVRAHAEQVAAMHELAREVGWKELGGRLLAELRNHVVADPSLRNLFISDAA
jgi:eukaryotic-like serine/threonine-protein kinase